MFLRNKVMRLGKCDQGSSPGASDGGVPSYKPSDPGDSGGSFFRSASSSGTSSTVTATFFRYLRTASGMSSYASSISFAKPSSSTRNGGLKRSGSRAQARSNALSALASSPRYV